MEYRKSKIRQLEFGAKDLQHRSLFLLSNLKENKLLVFQTTFLVYLYYSLSRKMSSLTDKTEAISTMFNSSINKVLDSFSKDIKEHNRSLLEDHYDKLRVFNKQIIDNQDLFITKTSKDANDMVLKVMEMNSTNSVVNNAPLPSPIHLHQGVITTSAVITVCVVLGIIGLATYYVVLPKATTLISDQYTIFQQLFSKLSQSIPGTNCAEGSIHIKGYPHYKIITKIISGKPEHIICDSRNDVNQNLSDFIEQLITNEQIARNLDLVETTAISNQFGSPLDIIGLLS